MPDILETANRVIKLDKAATPGEWGINEWDGSIIGGVAPDVIEVGEIENDCDTNFIIETRTAAPELAREVIRLTEEIEALRQLYDLRRQRTIEAYRAYQSAHGWGDNVFPDLGELIAWLMSERK